MKLGAYDFLEKPVEIDDLARLIERAIGERASERERGLRTSRRAGDRRPPPAPARRRPPPASGWRPPRAPCCSPARAAPARSSSPARIHALLAARERPVRRRQLRRDPRDADRERAVRPREGGLHRRRPPPAGALRAGRGRHALPRRDRRAAARRAGQAPARPRGAHLRAGRRRPDAQAPTCGWSRPPTATSRPMVRRRRVPRRPLLPPQRLPHRAAAAARPAERHPAPRPPPARRRSPAATAASRRALEEDAAELLAADSLAGQRPGAGERPREGGDPGRRAGAPRRRPAAAAPPADGGRGGRAGAAAPGADRGRRRQEESRRDPGDELPRAPAQGQRSTIWKACPATASSERRRRGVRRGSGLRLAVSVRRLVRGRGAW